VGNGVGDMPSPFHGLVRDPCNQLQVGVEVLGTAPLTDAPLDEEEALALAPKLSSAPDWAATQADSPSASMLEDGDVIVQVCPATPATVHAAPRTMEAPPPAALLEQSC